MNTKYGMVKTDHILFIAAGAFHVSKPSDLIPELQGRFPIRVELEALGREDFVRILTEPKSALIKQYIALLSTEGRDAAVHRRRDRADRRLRDAGQRAHREHRRAPAAHGDGEAARRDLVRGAGPRPTRTSRSTTPTSIARSPRSRGTKTSPGTSCERAARVDGRVSRGVPPRSRSCSLAGVRQEGAAAAAAALRSRGAGDRVSAPARRQRGPLHVHAADEEHAAGTGPIELDRVEVFAVTVAAGCARPAEPRPAGRRSTSSARSRSSRRRRRATPAPPAGARSEGRPRPAPGDVATFVEELNEAKLKPQIVATPAPRAGRAAATAAAAAAAAPRPSRSESTRR